VDNDYLSCVDNLLVILSKNTFSTVYATSLFSAGTGFKFTRSEVLAAMTLQHSEIYLPDHTVSQPRIPE